MHQIQFRLGLRPRPRWGSLQRSPDPLAGFEGPTSKGSEGRGRKRGEEGEGRDQEKGKEREGKGEGGEGKWDRDRRESLGARGREGKGVGKRGGEGKFRGPGGPQMFFSRTAPAQEGISRDAGDTHAKIQDDPGNTGRLVIL